MSDHDDKPAAIVAVLAELAVPMLSYNDAWRTGAMRGIEFSIEMVREHVVEYGLLGGPLIEDLRGMIEVVRTLDEPSPAFLQTPRPPVPALAAGERSAIEAAVLAERERCLRIVSHAPFFHPDESDDMRATVDDIAEEIRSGK